MSSEFFNNLSIDELLNATYETIFMTVLSLLGTFILGTILGLILYLTSSRGLHENKIVYFLTSAVVNIFRAIPFIILILLLFPFTDFLIGTIRGPKAGLPALIIAAAPFYGRLVEIALREVDKGVVEAAKSMGSSTMRIIFRVLLPESLPAIISGLTVTGIALIGYTAMAGAIGAGGLGNYAYYYGFQRRNFELVFVCTIVIVVIVFICQFIGDYVSKKIDKR